MTRGRRGQGLSKCLRRRACTKWLCRTTVATVVILVITQASILFRAPTSDLFEPLRLDRAQNTRKGREVPRRSYSIEPEDVSHLRVDRNGSRPPLTDDVRARALEQTAWELRREHASVFEAPGAAEPGRRPSSSVDTAHQQSTGALKVLLVSYYRSGSTFLGDLLNHYPGVFYHFEPLQSISGVQRVTSEEDEVGPALELLSRLLSCDYSTNSTSWPYYRWISKFRAPLAWNYRLVRACSAHPGLCLDPEFLSSACGLHPIQLVKTVRLRLQDAAALLGHFRDLAVVYLVRDPRALFNSRKALGWCRDADSCILPRIVCQDMMDDVLQALRMLRTHPGRFRPVRYEDLALDPEKETKTLLDFLGLRWNPMTEWFLDTHTQPQGPVDRANPYATTRNSSERVSAWRESLSADERAEVERHCGDVIRSLGLQ